MGTVSSYDRDNTIESTDKLFGTDSQTGKQKNFTLGDIVAFIIDNYIDSDGNFDTSAFAQNPLSEDLDAGVNKITSLKDGELDNDAVNKSQLAEVYDFTNSRNKIAGEVTSGAAIPAFASVSFSSAKSYIKLFDPDTGDVGYIPVYQDKTTGSAQ